MPTANKTASKKARNPALQPDSPAYVTQKAMSLQESIATTVKTFPALGNIWPGYGAVGDRESNMVDLPGSAAAYFAGGPMGLSGASAAVPTTSDDVLGVTTKQGETKIAHMLPVARDARYQVLRIMSTDPTIDSAIKMHIANALAPKHDDGEILRIVPRDGEDKKDPIVDDINAAIMPTIKHDVLEWARKAAIYGSCFVRVYGAKGIGIQNIRCDFYTHPRYIKKYNKGGRLAGYTTTYQNTAAGARQIRLMPPWAFVGFEIPERIESDVIEPVTVGAVPVDLSLDDCNLEGLVESQDYGESLIATAYGPWLDLLDAICSLTMSRRNAARLERIIGISTGKLDPERAARYINLISEQISNASSMVERQSWLQGNVQTVCNHFIPVFGEKGSIQIDAVQGTPDINGLEDINYYTKRLGSALGVDPALLGFGDMLSGGLGDGGFFRVSVLAAQKASFLQQAIKRGLQNLCEIHAAYKFGKVFMPGEEPWKIVFNANMTAIAREEQENLEARTNVVGGIVGSFRNR